MRRAIVFSSSLHHHEIALHDCILAGRAQHGFLGGPQSAIRLTPYAVEWAVIGLESGMIIGYNGCRPSRGIL